MTRILHGDCLDILPTLDAASIHSVVTDPPYELGFMGKKWDSTGVAFRPETWAEVFRVMKPGAFLVAFASTRGYHRMACAIEDAGFVIHPQLAWVFGSGFPKAHKFALPDMDDWRYGLQALKPGMEPICMAQKPLDGTGTHNWSVHGCGGLNIGACRVEGDLEQRTRHNNARAAGSSYVVQRETQSIAASAAGRWPANIIHDGSPEVLAAFERFGEKGGGHWSPVSGKRTVYSDGLAGPTVYHGERDGKGTAARFFPCCPWSDDELRFHYSGKADAPTATGPSIRRSNRWP